jgi:hypothetical protein
MSGRGNRRSISWLGWTQPCFGLSIPTLRNRYCDNVTEVDIDIMYEYLDRLFGDMSGAREGGGMITEWSMDT